MEVEIHCESCRVMLRVPWEAAGHRARCPGCGHEFTVPRMEELIEDTVSEWIEQDVEEVLEDRDRQTEEQIRAAIARQKEEEAKAKAAAEAESRHRRAAPHDGSPAHGNGHDPAEASPDEPAEQPPHDHGRSGEERKPRRLWPMRAHRAPSLPGGVTLPDDHAGGDHGRIAAESLMTTPPPSSHRRDADGEQHRYPANLHVEDRIPHLIVKKVDAAGVRFAFDSAWLGHEGFRASMPMRCVFSGSSAREKLIARPLVFMDRANASAPTIDRINSAHENRQVGDHAPRHIMRMMGLIEGFTHPFAYAMPYYVSTRYAHLHIHCQTRDRVSGGVTCEVLIPDGLTALDWLARVNGVCGKEYELLEHDVGLRHGDAWAQLPEECRQRIAAWCKLGAQEVLLQYFNDADFGKRDAGLAGLVVTDQRLVFSKYHHRGQARLDSEDTAVLARGEGKFVSLSLRVGKEVHRMIKLHRHDLDRLTQTLQQAGKIRVQVMQEA